ncbi:MAG: hypothetical protein P8Q45_03580 [Candidatus Thalassarchaeaceae archaeon]|nr:hypothetical protein [Candidatus Thalassarchaeaceae archaeon]
MSKRGLLIFVMLLLSMAGGVQSTSAQTVTPAVELSCSPASISIDVYPGATRIGYTTCTVSNPSVHYEEINIIYQAGPLVISGIGSVSLGPGLEEEFQVHVRADAEMAEGQHQIRITAYVDTVNGVPSPTQADSEVNVLAIINQFSRLRVEAVDPLVTMGVGEEMTVNFLVYNDGNAMDTFLLELEFMDELNDAGWVALMSPTKVQVESRGPPERVRITLEAPDDTTYLEGGTSTSNGTTEYWYSVGLKVTSEFSLRVEGVPNYQIETSVITLQEYPEESGLASVTEALPSLGAALTILTILGVAVTTNRHH